MISAELKSETTTHLAGTVRNLRRLVGTLEGRTRRQRNTISKQQRMIKAANDSTQAHQLRAMAAEQKLQLLIAQNGETDLLGDGDAERIQKLHLLHVPMNEIAKTFNLDLVTTAMVIEGLA